MDGNCLLELIAQISLRQKPQGLKPAIYVALYVRAEALTRLGEETKRFLLVGLLAGLVE